MPTLPGYGNEDRVLSAGGVGYGFDADGFLSTRMAGGATGRYTYSARGELLRVELPGGRVIEYLYDAMERRIAKKVNGAVMEKYLWNGMTQLLAVYDGAGSLLQRFQYADGRIPVAMTAGGATYFLAWDQAGSLRTIADSAGVVVKTVDYDTFGNILADSNPGFSVPFGFAGGLHDRDTGLVRFGYRDYAPEIGRWTAKDPILFAGGDTNLYGYVLADPVNLVDPLGLWNINFNYTGGPGRGGTYGVQFSPSGIYAYAGYGVATGAGASVTLESSNPSVGAEGYMAYSGGNGTVGSFFEGQYGFDRSYSPNGGIGWGVGFGVSAGVKVTSPIIEWGNKTSNQKASGCN